MSVSEYASNQEHSSSWNVVLQRFCEVGKTHRQPGRLVGRFWFLDVFDEKRSSANSGPLLPLPWSRMAVWVCAALGGWM